MSSPAYVPSPDDRFPDCYPRNPKPCAPHGVAFFDCLNKNSEKLTPDDTEAGARALKACLVSFIGMVAPELTLRLQGVNNSRPRRRCTKIVLGNMKQSIRRSASG